MDILERLEKWLKKDQIVARNWNEDGVSIDGDIEVAIDEIRRLRASQPTTPADAKEPCEYCSIEDLCIQNFCPRCGRDLRR